MHWVIQTNLMNEKSFEPLMEQIHRQNVKHTLAKVIPFSHEMEIVGGDEIPSNEKPIYVCGATSLSKIAKANGWKPGYFDENIDYWKLLNEYNTEALNNYSYFTTLLAVNFDRLPQEFFVRPRNDGKSFSGQVFTKEEFSMWRKQVLLLSDEENTFTTLKAATDDIVIAPLKEIYSEYRFYIVDGKVVTGSLYKLGKQVIYSDNVDPYLYEYAQKMVNIWQPNRAFALDVAVTEEGPKVLEINAINSAGFYACDMGKYVAAINSMEF